MRCFVFGVHQLICGVARTTFADAYTAQLKISQALAVLQISGKSLKTLENTQHHSTQQRNCRAVILYRPELLLVDYYSQ